MKNYPSYVVVNGTRYNINTDYRIALRCFEIISDDEISDLERSLAIIYTLYGELPNDAQTQEKLLELASKYLQCGESIETQSRRADDMDFEQDSGYIYASFLSDYGFDVTEKQLHWWKYIELIQGLSENAILSRVREIRNYDLNEVKDAKQKQKLIEAKQHVAIKKKRTKEEEQMINDFEKLFI